MTGVVFLGRGCRVGLRSCLAPALVVWMGVSLSACASAPQWLRFADAASSTQVDGAAKAEAKKEAGTSISPDLMYRLLLGEIAAQRGAFDVAVSEYVDAASESADVGVARRATQMGVFAKDYAAALKAARRWAQLAPGSLDPWKHLGVLNLRVGDYPASAEAFEGFVERLAAKDESASARLYEVVGAVLLREADTAGALKVMGLLAAKVPENLAAQEAYARMAFSSGNEKESLAAARRLLQADPSNRAANVIVANALLADGKTAGAVAQLKRALEVAPEDNQLRLAYARLLLQAKDPALARAEFERLAEDVPDNADVLYALALLALQAGEHDKAKPLLERLLALGARRSDASYYLARIAVSEKDYDLALKRYAEVKRGDYLQEAKLQMANVLAASGKLDEARAHLKALRSEQSELREQAYLLEASLLSDAKRQDEAMALLDEAVGALPTSVDLLYSRGLLAEEMGDLKRLEEDMRQVLALNPEHVDALNALGYTFADHNMRLKEALSLIERALQLRPNEPAILDSMGWVHYRMGDFDQAEGFLRKALKAQYDGEIAAHLGEVLWKKKQHKAAREVFDEALNRDPDDPALQRTVQRLLK